LLHFIDNLIHNVLIHGKFCYTLGKSDIYYTLKKEMLTFFL